MDAFSDMNAMRDLKKIKSSYRTAKKKIPAIFLAVLSITIMLPLHVAATEEQTAIQFTDVSETAY